MLDGFVGVWLEGMMVASAIAIELLRLFVQWLAEAACLLCCWLAMSNIVYNTSVSGGYRMNNDDASDSDEEEPPVATSFSGIQDIAEVFFLWQMKKKSSNILSSQLRKHTKPLLNMDWKEERGGKLLLKLLELDEPTLTAKVEYTTVCLIFINKRYLSTDGRLYALRRSDWSAHVTHNANWQWPETDTWESWPSRT